MTTWNLMNVTPQEWNRQVISFEDHSLYQMHEWGLQKQRQGWKVQKWGCFQGDNKPETLIQTYTKLYLGKIAVIWAAGGPLGNYANLNEALIRQMLDENGVKQGYVRIFSQRKYDAWNVLNLRSLGWRRPSTLMNSGLSMRLVAKNGSFLDDMTANWRHNLRRSQKKELRIEVWEKPSLRQLIEVYKSMEEYKSLVQQYSPDILSDMLECLREKVVLLKCLDDNRISRLLYKRNKGMGFACCD